MPKLSVLVTNDDGVDAPGIDVLVAALAADPAVAVTVVAPATNQTGAGEAITTTTFDVAPAATASGHPATAVGGSPSDTVLFAVRQLLARPPALVVSGINAGPNLADFVTVSGTVAAALAAARLGIPAIAVSAGLAVEMDYDAPARFVASLVSRFRTDRRFRTRMMLVRAQPTGIVLNVNFPPAGAGVARGVRVVGLGRLADVTGYTRTSAAGPVTTWAPVVRMGDVSTVDFTSTLTTPATDLEAFNHGFVAVTPLVPDLTFTAALDGFRFVET